MTAEETVAVQIARRVGEILNLNSADNVINSVKLCRLSAVVQNQSSGTPGAGLSGGLLQESLWVDMLLESGFGFTKETTDATTVDADYYMDGIPISHKTIGYKGTGDLALAWSKNPPDGLQRTVFNAPMAIACMKKPGARTWGLVDFGYYVVPLDYLRSQIQFNSNNKTDSLISRHQVVSAIEYSRAIESFVPLPYDHDWGLRKSLSHWRAGLGAVIENEHSEGTPS